MSACMNGLRRQGHAGDIAVANLAHCVLDIIVESGLITYRYFSPICRTDFRLRSRDWAVTKSPQVHLALTTQTIAALAAEKLKLHNGARRFQFSSNFQIGIDAIFGRLPANLTAKLANPLN